MVGEARRVCGLSEGLGDVAPDGGGRRGRRGSEGGEGGGRCRVVVRRGGCVWPADLELKIEAK